MSTNRDTSEREADTYWPSAYVTKPERAAPVRRTSIRTEERIGSLMAGPGILRIAYVARVDFAELLQFKFCRFVRWTFVPSVSSFGCVRSGGALSSSIRR